MGKKSMVGEFLVADNGSSFLARRFGEYVREHFAQAHAPRLHVLKRCLRGLPDFESR